MTICNYKNVCNKLINNLKYNNSTKFYIHDVANESSDCRVPLYVKTIIDSNTDSKNSIHMFIMNLTCAVSFGVSTKLSKNTFPYYTKNLKMTDGTIYSSRPNQHFIITPDSIECDDQSVIYLTWLIRNNFKIPKSRVFVYSNDHYDKYVDGNNIYRKTLKENNINPDLYTYAQMANYPLTNRKNLIKQVKKKTRAFLNFSKKTRKMKAGGYNPYGPSIFKDDDIPDIPNIPNIQEAPIEMNNINLYAPFSDEQHLLDFINNDINEEFLDYFNTIEELEIDIYILERTIAIREQQGLDNDDMNAALDRLNNFLRLAQTQGGKKRRTSKRRKNK